MSKALASAVDKFANLTIGLSEPQLDLPWVWGDYDSEGIRFSMFRTFEELRTLAVRLRIQRLQDGPAMTEAQQILAGLHRAYRRLKVILMSLEPSFFTQHPAEEEWPIRQALSHIYNAEMNFFVVIRYGLHRSLAPNLPVSPPDEFWDDKIGMTELEFETFLSEPAELILTALEAIHARVLADFVKISTESLAFEAKFWETELMPLRFRLHRFESHMRQHTVQIEKTLVQLGYPPGEPRRLLYLIYDALAEVENTLLGAPEHGVRACADLANKIDARADEIEAILSGEES